MNDQERFNAAAQNENFNDIKALMKQGLAIDTKDDDGFTALHWAAFEGDKEFANFLINQGANINIVDNEGYTALEIACNYQQIGIVKLLIVNKVDLTKNREGFTPLHAAAAVGSEKIVELLIDAGSSVNDKDANGTDRTPLHWAAQEGHLKVVKLLIKKNADIYAIDDSGFTAFHIATSEGHLDLIKIMVKKFNLNLHLFKKIPPLTNACAWGHFEIAKILVEVGCDINGKDEDGILPTHYAAYYGHMDIVNYLMSKGGVISDVEMDDTTLLESATENGYLEVIELINKSNKAE